MLVVDQRRRVLVAGRRLGDFQGFGLTPQIDQNLGGCDRRLAVVRGQSAKPLETDQGVLRPAEPEIRVGQTHQGCLMIRVAGQGILEVRDRRFVFAFALVQVAKHLLGVDHSGIQLDRLQQALAGSRRLALSDVALGKHDRPVDSDLALRVGETREVLGRLRAAAAAGQIAERLELRQRLLIEVRPRRVARPRPVEVADHPQQTVAESPRFGARAAYHVLRLPRILGQAVQLGFRCIDELERSSVNGA